MPCHASPLIGRFSNNFIITKEGGRGHGVESGSTVIQLYKFRSENNASKSN